MCGEESVVVNFLSSDVKSNMTGQCCSAYHKNSIFSVTVFRIKKSLKYVFNMSQTQSHLKGISNRRKYLNVATWHTLTCLVWRSPHCICTLTFRPRDMPPCYRTSKNCCTWTYILFSHQWRVDSTDYSDIWKFRTNDLQISLWIPFSSRIVQYVSCYDPSNALARAKYRDRTTIRIFRLAADE